MKKIFISLFLITTACAQQKDGSLDPLFGTNGQVQTCGDDAREGRRIIIQPDNKIVVGGFDEEAGGFLLIRYNTDGTLDSSFGTSGVVATDFGPSTNLFALALQPDNKIIAAGSNVDNNNFFIARYNPNGTLDTTFGTAGFVNELALSGVIHDVAIQTNGKIVAVGGDTDPETANDGKIVRYNSDGTRDASFGINGLVTVTIPGSDVNLRAVQLQTDGKIVVVGTITNGTTDLFIARYLGDGSIDTSFGNGGFQTLQIAGNSTFGKDVAIQANGDIVALMDNVGDDVALVRFTSDGLLDPAFGNTGIVIVDPSANAERVQLQSDGKIVIVATDNNVLLLARVTSDGVLDTSFGTNGKVTLTVFGLDSEGFDLAINAQGEILATGRVIGADSCVAVVQIQVNSLDYSQTSQALWTRYYNQNIQQRFA